MAGVTAVPCRKRVLHRFTWNSVGNSICERRLVLPDVRNAVSEYEDHGVARATAVWSRLIGASG